MGIVHLAVRANNQLDYCSKTHIYCHFAASTTNTNTSIGKFPETTGGVMEGMSEY